METAAVTNFPPNVTPEMLRADFWLDRATDVDTPLIAPEQIAAFNARVYETLDIPAVLNMPNYVHRMDLRMVIALSQPGAAVRYGWDGDPLSDETYERWKKSTYLDVLDTVKVEFGVVTQRTDVRAFPTTEVATKQPFEFALDRNQETTVDVGTPVATLGMTRDREWYWTLTPHYWGWVRTAHIALGDRGLVTAYETQKATSFVVTIAPHGLIALPEGGITVQMGTVLPQCTSSEHDSVRGVELPTPSPMVGILRVTTGYTADTSQFSDGFLPPTLRGVFTQVFKLLGERYAWGGSRMGIFGRDCSRMIRDVYATTGVQLPRNGDQQAQVCREVVAFTPEMDDVARKAALVEQVPPGAILELSGHVMLYLGHINGEPFVIHNTSSGRYHGVIVSDLSLGGDGEAGSLLARLRQAVVLGL